jgi:hypothetical protein
LSTTRSGRGAPLQCDKPTNGEPTWDCSIATSRRLIPLQFAIGWLHAKAPLCRIEEVQLHRALSGFVDRVPSGSDLLHRQIEAFNSS